MIEFRTLGPTSLKGPEGNELHSVLSRPKLLSLLLVMGAWGGSGYVRREVLMGLFWGELDQERARANLRQFLYKIRSSLGSDSIESRGEDEVRLNPRVAWCDVRAFEEARANGELEKALSLYQGDLLEGLFPPNSPEFERWLDQRRVGLQRSSASMAWSLAEQMSDDGNQAAAGHWARRAADLGGSDESLSRRCIGLLDRLGDQGGALELYQGLERKLKDLEAEPSSQTRKLIEEIRARGAGAGIDDPEEASTEVPILKGAEVYPRSEDMQKAGVAGTEDKQPADYNGEGESAVSPGNPTELVGAGSSASDFHPRDWFGRKGVGIVLFLAALLVVPVLGRSLDLPLLGGRSLGQSGSLPSTVIAVLPFEGLGGDSDFEYFAAGIHTDLIAQLSRVPGLTVIPADIVDELGDTELSLRETGTDLGAGSILQGSIQWEAGRARVNADLKDSFTGASLWSETYDPEVPELLNILREIAFHTAATLEGVSSSEDVAEFSRPSTRDLAAYRPYLRSRGLAGERATFSDLMVEEQLLRQALTHDPGFANAWGALAMNFARRAWEFGQSGLLADSAMVAAQTALSLDPESVEGHLVMGWAYLQRGYLDRAQESLSNSIRLNPNLAQAYLLLGRTHLSSGRFDEAIEDLHQGLQRNPDQSGIRAFLGFCYASLGDFSEGERWVGEELRRMEEGSASRAHMQVMIHTWRGQQEEAFQMGLGMVAAAPDVPQYRAYLADLAFQAGRCTSALEHARRAMALSSDPDGVRFFFFASTILGKSLQECGDRDEGARHLERSREKLLNMVENGYLNPLAFMELAAVSEALGDRETAVVWLQRGVQLGLRLQRYVELHPLLDTLREEPEVRAMIDQIRSDLVRQRDAVRSGPHPNSGG